MLKKIKKIHSGGLHQTQEYALEIINNHVEIGIETTDELLLLSDYLYDLYLKNNNDIQK
ncbi:hypothetical protein VA7868_02635 [Vibrio aerogenes CECT 7868]|uniref:Uncharacterized protein n=1 Tax=Vibrio aerogenes CECT 7868 TaxID=1216006 RepID=A0A1M5ZEV2_9VIBR|nr:hypothetical protein VA7868_02635 [Vibrio aerogenes CECT 7868]